MPFFSSMVVMVPVVTLRSISSVAVIVNPSSGFQAEPLVAAAQISDKRDGEQHHPELADDLAGAGNRASRRPATRTRLNRRQAQPDLRRTPPEQAGGGQAAYRPRSRRTRRAKKRLPRPSPAKAVPGPPKSQRRRRSRQCRIRRPDVAEQGRAAPEQRRSSARRTAPSGGAPPAAGRGHWARKPCRRGRSSNWPRNGQTEQDQKNRAFDVLLLFHVVHRMFLRLLMNVANPRARNWQAGQSPQP